MIDALFFDLDNTLYPASLGLEDAVVTRMAAYAAAFLGTSPEAAMALRRSRLALYGTTLEWLMAEHGLTDIEHYFAAVHPEGEEADLVADPRLGGFLSSLSQPKYIFTNSPREHAERILAKLGVAGHFEAIYDIRFNRLQGKPALSAAQRVLAAAGHAPERSLFADDVVRYVRGFIAAGGRGVLVDEAGREADSGLDRIQSIYELPRFLSARS